MPSMLVINQHYPPDTLASGQILAELAEDLVTRYGWQVDVVAGPPLKLAEGQSWQWAWHEQRAGVRVLRVPSYNPERRTVGRRLWHYGSYGMYAMLRGLQARRPDIVFVMSTPPILTGLLGWWHATLRGARFVYDIQDLFPDILQPRMVGSAPGRAAYASLSAVAKQLERRADHVIVIGERMRSIMHTHGLSPEKVSVIPNWADSSAIVPLGKNTDFARRHGLAGRFVVMYSGNLGLNQDLDSVIAAADLCRDRADIVWLMVGDGESRERLQAEALRRRLTQMRFLPYQPKETLAQSLSAADVGLVTVSGGVSPFLIPSKLYGIMAAGSAVLAAVDPGSEVEDFVTRNGLGQTVAPGQPEALAQQVRRMADDPAGVRRCGVQARAVLEQQCSRAACTARYHQLLSGLLA